MALGLRRKEGAAAWHLQAAGAKFEWWAGRRGLRRQVGVTPCWCIIPKCKDWTQWTNSGQQHF